VRRKNIEAYLRAATCLSKLGCLAAADRVLDKVREGRGCFVLLLLLLLLVLPLLRLLVVLPLLQR
jgi:hypothetical protein